MTEETPIQPPEKEPTVLDLYKSATRDWDSFQKFIRSVWDARQRAEWNQSLAQEATRQVEQPVEEADSAPFPWRTVGAFAFALIGQALLEPSLRLVMISMVFYFAAFGIGLWAYRAGEWSLPSLPSPMQWVDPFSVRSIPLGLAGLAGVVAFFAFSDGEFTFLNTALWLASMALLVYGFWVKLPKSQEQAEPVVESAPKVWDLGWIEVKIRNFDALRNKWAYVILLTAAVGVVIFFRFTLLDKVPDEPFSDHAEKISDIYEITSLGNTNIFFPRNTGREAFQMYWTLLIITIFKTGYTFQSLKLGTALLGLFTVPFVYQLGKEYGGTRVAFFALFLFGVASWPNIISRIGLRFPLYPLFVAPTLLYLIRGLRTQNRNDFILSGIFLGIGLHGYSPIRILPFLVAVVVLIYILHVKSGDERRQAIFWFLLVALVSAFVFSPLLRYWIAFPENFAYRSLTRLSSLETPLPGPAWQIFLSNMYRGLLMFNWDDGGDGTHAVTYRPALDMFSAALFLMGIFFLIVRYIRRRDWRDLTLLVSIPILILPSVLSLAFPNENPAMNRAGGASVAVFVVGAVALDGLVTSFGSGLKRKVIAYSMVGILFAGIAFQNYDLVFRQFSKSFSSAHWNSSEMGKFIADFERKNGQTDTAWIVPYPYWVDTRLPGIWAGVPNRDFALWPDQLPESLNYPAPKMFIFWNADPDTERLLRELYPQGKLSRYTSASPGKDFYVFMVER